MEPPQQIYVYDEGTAPALDAQALAAYLREQTGCRMLHRRGPLLLEHSSADEQRDLAARIARLKVHDPDTPPTEYEPAYAEVEFERRRLANQDRAPFGVLYDGFGFQRLLRDLLPPSEVRLNRVHLVFTNRMLGTWDEGDRRYHLRAIMLGIPAVISTTGLVEAPAKPREFYLARQQLGRTARAELAHALLKEQFKGQFLDHDDARLAEVVKGYAMQAMVYQIAGEAFCDNRECRLFNAHWQAELLRAQLGGEREYCARHEEMLARMREARWGEAV